MKLVYVSHSVHENGKTPCEDEIIMKYSATPNSIVKLCFPHLLLGYCMPTWCECYSQKGTNAQL